MRFPKIISTSADCAFLTASQTTLLVHPSTLLNPSAIPVLFAAHSCRDLQQRGQWTTLPQFVHNACEKISKDQPQRTPKSVKCCHLRIPVFLTMFAIAVVDSPLTCPLAELSTQGMISVRVGDWVPAIVESSDFHQAHLESSMTCGGKLAMCRSRC